MFDIKYLFLVSVFPGYHAFSQAVYQRQDGHWRPTINSGDKIGFTED